MNLRSVSYLFLLFRTLIRLRMEQLTYRPFRMAQYRFYQAFPRATSRWTNGQIDAPNPEPGAIASILSIIETQPIKLEDLIDNRFTFLNRTLVIKPIDWNRRYESHLWNYHLHYFDYVVPAAATLVESGDARPMRYSQKLIESWIENAQIGKSDGWDPYPISLRVVNWIYAYSLLVGFYDDRRFLERWRASIYRQLDFLNFHLEYQHLANHLLKNIKALLMGGLFFSNEKWASKGERLLWREFDEQVLEDGGHYERSPMYHAQALNDFLVCWTLLKAGSRVRTKLRAMARFLEAMSYPDGTLALFNDTANTEEFRPGPILDPALRMLSFPKTGYYVWVSNDKREKMIVDAGPPSAGYNSAHAHCDLLSYELRLDGKPFIVDSGVHGYGGDRFREYSRSTRAHNTVMFDGREQSEVWGTFRMARQAQVAGAEADGDERSWNFRGEYRPYYDHRLIHERQIRREVCGCWLFSDRLIGGGAAERATSFIHLHPNVQAVVRDGIKVDCDLGTTKVFIEAFGAESLKIIKGSEAPIQGWYFPAFGIAQQSATICIEYRVRSGKSFGYRIIPQKQKDTEKKNSLCLCAFVARFPV
jgi:uncharacterized heparinase superfamily protein